MWVNLVAIFLAVSLFLYCVLAGADFGAGILETFSRGEKSQAERDVISHAIAPVWEANHVWIILALVILFVGFPPAFSRLSIAFHLPLTMMLVGIVMRGCAFTFRHYDAVKDGSQRAYSAIFVLSSWITPLLLGIIAGGLILGRIPASVTPSSSYAENFIAPWFNWFSLSVGVFTCALFAFIAAVFLIGEAPDEELRSTFKRRAQAANVAAVLSGLAVFAAAQVEGFGLVERFLDSKLSWMALCNATLLLLPLWQSIQKRALWMPRFLAATQIAAVLLGWMALQYPVLIPSIAPGASLTLSNSASPEASLRQLLYALLIGSALIFPAMSYLFAVFKKSPASPH